MLISFNTGGGIVSALTALGSTKLHRLSRITQSEYQQWRREFCFDALKNMRYGQSFCNHFNITDYRIFYDSDVERCDQLIVRDWVNAAN